MAEPPPLTCSMSPRWTFGIPGLVTTSAGLATLAASILGFVPSEWMGLAHVFSTVATVIGWTRPSCSRSSAKFIAIERQPPPAGNEGSSGCFGTRGTLEQVQSFSGFVIAFVCTIIGIVARLWFKSPVEGAFLLQLQAFLEIGLIIGGQTRASRVLLRSPVSVARAAPFPAQTARDLDIPESGPQRDRPCRGLCNECEDVSYFVRNLAVFDFDPAGIRRQAFTQPFARSLQ